MSHPLQRRSCGVKRASRCCTTTKRRAPFSRFACGANMFGGGPFGGMPGMAGMGRPKKVRQFALLQAAARAERRAGRRTTRASTSCWTARPVPARTS